MNQRDNMKKAKKRLDKPGGTSRPDKTGGTDQPARLDKAGRANQPGRLDLRSMSVTEDQKRKLKQLFPEVFVEKKINFEKLKATLGEELETGREFYDISWQGKRDCFRIIQEPSLGALKPCKKESLDWANTQNLFIEGDNLEVLKLLQKSYYGQVKMIYIDPPYNTGKDFIYPDKYSESLETYLQYTGQKDSSGQKFSTNQETDGRFHSNWLNMMYPRLSLASNLLRDDGVIFISIDDNEVANLRKICDDIFGEENFVNCINIKTKIAGVSGSYLGQSLQKNVEYVLFYSKSPSLNFNLDGIYEERDLFSYIREYKEKGKSWKYTRVIDSFGKKEFYKSITDGAGKEIKIFKHKKVRFKTISDLLEMKMKKNKNYSEKEKNQLEKELYIEYFDKIFRDTNAQSSIRQRVIEATKNLDDFLSIEYIPESGKNKGNLTRIYYKGKKKDLIAWLKDVSEKKEKTIIKKDKIGTLWSDLNYNNISKEGNIQYPNGKKPILLIKRMMQLVSCSEGDIILDFFAGSGTTAHAVMEYGKEQNIKLRSISIQLPEVISKADRDKYYSNDDLKKFKTIADIGKERIRRAVKQIKEKEAAERKKRVSRRGSAGQEAADGRQTSLFEEGAGEGKGAALGKSEANPPDPPYQGGFTSSPYQGGFTSSPYQGGFTSSPYQGGRIKRDFGFRVFKLDKSNFRRYDEKIHKKKDKPPLKPDGKTCAFNEEQMSFHLDRFIDRQSSEEDLLYEILIKTGFQLTTKIQTLNLAGKKVYSVEDDALLICLEKKISQDMIIEAAKRSPGRVIFLDRGFEGNDHLKTNAKETFNSFGVMDFKTV